MKLNESRYAKAVEAVVREFLVELKEVPIDPDVCSEKSFGLILKDAVMTLAGHVRLLQKEYAYYGMKRIPTSLHKALIRNMVEAIQRACNEMNKRKVDELFRQEYKSVITRDTADQSIALYYKNKYKVN